MPLADSVQGFLKRGIPKIDGFFYANLTSTLTNSLQMMLTHILRSRAGRPFLSSPRRKVFHRLQLRSLSRLVALTLVAWDRF